MRKGAKGGKLDAIEEDQSVNRYGQGQGRAPLPLIKRQVRHVKTPTGGLAKNRAQLILLKKLLFD